MGLYQGLDRLRLRERVRIRLIQHLVMLSLSGARIAQPKRLWQRLLAAWRLRSASMGFVPVPSRLVR